MADIPTVFLSWSGPRSKAVATSLADCIRSTSIVKTWMSAYDINDGALWINDIMSSLKSTHYGIACITPENLNSGWIHFEVGALWRGADESRVIPYLFELERDRLASTPLNFLQSEYAAKEGSRKLFTWLQNIVSSNTPQLAIDAVFEQVFWPQHEVDLKAIGPSPKAIDEQIEEAIAPLGPEPEADATKIENSKLAAILCEYCACNMNTLAGLIKSAKSYYGLVITFLTKYVLPEHRGALLKRAVDEQYKEEIINMRAALNPVPYPDI